MSKKTKAKGRGIHDLFMADALPTGSSYGADALPTGSSYGAPEALTFGDSFVLSSKPMSTKARMQAAAAEKAAAEAAAAAENAKQVERDRLYEEYMKMHQPPKPPKSVTCALCNKSKTVGDAIAHKWKKHPLGFTNQAICAECYVPSPSSPKLVWKYGGTKSKSKSKRSKSRSRSKSKRSRSKSRSRSRF
jgi:hypothetical protein